MKTFLVIKDTKKSKGNDIRNFLSGAISVARLMDILLNYFSFTSIYIRIDIYRYLLCFLKHE